MKRRLPAIGIGALAGAGVYLALRRVPRTDKPESGKRTIVCIGDSITYGAGVKPTRSTDAWPYVLNRRLGGDCCVLNYGVSGATARDDGDFPYRGHGYLPEAEKAGAELALLMLGTNDSKPYNWDKDGYERDILRLIGELRSCCGQLVLLLPPKAFPAEDGVVAFDIRDEVISDEILPILRRAAEDLALPVIDLYAFTQDHPEYFDDGVHPNVVGNHAIADHVFTRLSELGLLG